MSPTTIKSMPVHCVSTLCQWQYFQRHNTTTYTTASPTSSSSSPTTTSTVTTPPPTVKQYRRRGTLLKTTTDIVSLEVDGASTPVELMTLSSLPKYMLCLIVCRKSERLRGKMGSFLRSRVTTNNARMAIITSRINITETRAIHAQCHSTDIPRTV